MVPQLMNSCGQQRGVLSLKPTATRVVYSSIQSYRDDTQRVSNQAPDSFLLAASRQAQDLAPGHPQVVLEDVLDNLALGV